MRPSDHSQHAVVAALGWALTYVLPSFAIAFSLFETASGVSDGPIAAVASLVPVFIGVVFVRLSNAPAVWWLGIPHLPALGVVVAYSVSIQSEYRACAPVLIAAQCAVAAMCLIERVRYRKSLRPRPPRLLGRVLDHHWVPPPDSR